LFAPDEVTAKKGRRFAAENHLPVACSLDANVQH